MSTRKQSELLPLEFLGGPQDGSSTVPKGTRLWTSGFGEVTLEFPGLPPEAYEICLERGQLIRKGIDVPGRNSDNQSR